MSLTDYNNKYGYKLRWSGKYVILNENGKLVQGAHSSEDCNILNDHEIRNGRKPTYTYRLKTKEEIQELGF